MGKVKIEEEDSCWKVVKILQRSKAGRKVAKSLIEIILEREDHNHISFENDCDNLMCMFNWSVTHQGHKYWSNANKIFSHNKEMRQSCISHKIDVA